MRRYSAAEAIGPAWEHARQFVFGPYRFGRSWKLGATAYLSLIGSAFLPFPLIYLVFARVQMQHGQVMAARMTAFFACLATLVFLGIFHLCSRLQLSFFEMLITRQKFVRPSWRNSRDYALRWTGLKCIIGAIAMLVFGVPLSILAKNVFATLMALQAHKSGGALPPHVIGTMFAGYGLMMAAMLLLFVGSAVMADFVIPSLVLERTTIRFAFHRFGALIKAEPGSFLGFVLLRLALLVVGYIASMVMFYVLLILIILAAVIVGGALGLLLHFAGVPSPLLIGLGIFLGASLYLFCLVYGLLLILGTTLTVLQLQALYYLGGRYPLLGDLLEPPVVLDTFTPPPSLPSEDDSSGPDLPLNPQPAG